VGGRRATEDKDPWIVLGCEWEGMELRMLPGVEMMSAVENFCYPEGTLVMERSSGECYVIEGGGLTYAPLHTLDTRAKIRARRYGPDGEG